MENSSNEEFKVINEDTDDSQLSQPVVKHKRDPNYIGDQVKDNLSISIDDEINIIEGSNESVKDSLLRENKFMASNENPINPQVSQNLCDDGDGKMLPDKLSEDERENLLNDIVTISKIINIGDVKKEMQGWYAYVNKVYLDLSSKIEREQQRIDTMVKETYGNKVMEMQSKMDSAMASLNNRVLIIEEEVKKIRESMVSSRKSRKSTTAEAAKITDIIIMKQDIDDSNTLAKSLKDDIKTSLDLANAQFNDFLLFKKEFDDNIIPILNRINEDFIKGSDSATPTTNENDVQILNTGIDDLKNFIALNLQLANAQHKEFLDFKNEFHVNAAAPSEQDERAVANDPFTPIYNNPPENRVSTNDRDFNRVGERTNIIEINRSPAYQQNRLSNRHMSSEIIDCEVLFLTDSNLHKMKEDIMNHGTKATKLFCPHWKDVEFVINNSEFRQKPKQVYIQTITNDIERADFQVDEMCSRIKEVLENLKGVVDEDVGEIYVSSIFPRSDKMDMVGAMNKALGRLVKEFPYVKFLEQKNIVSSMLRDRKHLDREGFRTLLANIRFALFGKLPRFSTSNPKYTNGSSSYHYQDDQQNYTNFWEGL